MIRIDAKENCSGCGACMNACPRNAITMRADGEGFLYPVVGAGCVDCGRCEAVCPFLHPGEPTPITETVGCRASDEALRAASSSGGVFSLLAHEIQRRGGAVFGACLSGDGKSVRHQCADPEALRTSKYVQSDTGTVYREVREKLEEHVPVLFTGTPCQIGGLKHFLGKPYDGLVCAEVICHGVPSPALWKKYVEHLARQYRLTPRQINFRQKRYDGKKRSLQKTGGEVTVYSDMKKDPYLQLFLQNISLRPSCYACRMREGRSQADLTMGDFWVARLVMPALQDGRGLSLLLIHTEQGRALWNSVREKTVWAAADAESALKYNTPYRYSVSRPAKRERFFADMDRLSFPALSRRYVGRVRLSVRDRLAFTPAGTLIRKRILKKKIEFSFGLLLRGESDEE